MPIAGRKVLEFFIVHFSLLGVYVFTLYNKPDLLLSLGVLILILIFANGTIFISFNSLDKWMKSKWFNPDINKKDEENKG